MSDENIDDIIHEIENEETEEEIDYSVPAEKDELTEVDVTDDNDIAEALVNMTVDDRDKADKLFDLFYGDLSLGKDHSTSSKEAIAKALELKIDAGKNLIELLKIKKRSESSTNNILAFETVSEKKSGIDLSKIKDFVDSNQ